MAFTPKAWQNSLSTPISAAALTDLEQRVYNGSLADQVVSVNAGNIASTFNYDMNGAKNAMLSATITGNVTITLSDVATTGMIVRLILTQNATGNYTVNLSDGTTTSPLTVDPTPLSSTVVEVISPDGLNLYVIG